MSDGEDEPKTSGFTIGWWNSHLTPPKGSKLPDLEKALVLATLEAMLSTINIFFLGEVDQEDMAWLDKNIGRSNLTFQFFQRHDGKANYNLGVIYRNDVAFFDEPIFKTAGVGGKNYKLAVQIDALICDALEVRFFLSHWPSRLMLVDEAPNRLLIGQSLRQEVDESLGRGCNNIILLGDYNEEPYNQSMRSFLRATRDAAHVSRKRELLYNPFWKHIACPNGYSRDGELPSPTGTYFYAADDIHKWLTFDQMLFSHGFVGGSDWHLVDKSVTVYRDPTLVSAVESGRFKVDHLPIIAAIVKD